MDISLLPAMGGFIWTILAFIVALSVIVAIHEYGHYIVGRWSGIHAEVFSIGFGPVLWSTTDKRGTVWQFAAIPFGGYVKFLGDANAASVGEDGLVRDMTPDERRRTMPGAPLWARSATVLAGPLFNFILSIIVFGCFVLFGGLAEEDAVIGKVKALPADMVTLQEGDRVLSVNGTAVSSLSDLMAQRSAEGDGDTVTYEIERGGQPQTVTATWPMIAVIDSVTPRTAAMEAGLKIGDVIETVNGMELRDFEHLRTTVGNSDGAPLTLEIWRAGEALEVTLEPRRMDIPLAEGGFETRYLMGISGGTFFEPVTRSAGLWESVSYGWTQTLFIINSSLSALYNIAIGAISTCNLSGPIGIAETSGAAASLGASQFVWFIAVLSTAVGLFNLFPIPVLDGGHLVFHAYEAVARKKPSDAVVRVMMIAGLSLMGLLMVFAVSQDLFC